MSLTQEQLKGLRVGVLCGGSSSEREISLLSGRAVHESLIAAGLEPALLDVRENDCVEAIRRSGIGFAFIALHGSFGEDGVLQSLLEQAGIPYSGSGPQACRAAMDKAESRRLFEAAGLKIPRGIVIGDPSELSGVSLRFPLFAKPASSGSSVAVSLVKNAGGLDEALRLAFEEDDTVILDEKIEGRELTVGVLGDEALPPIEIKTEREFYDYAAKYQDTGTRYESPADLSASAFDGLCRAALAAHRALGCAGVSRADFILAADGPYILEVNAIPGLTRKSLLPKMAAKIGLSFPDLCVKIIEESMKRNSQWQKTNPAAGARSSSI